MSRIGKKLIEIPSNVKINIESEKITIQGPYGLLEQKISTSLDFLIKENQLFIIRKEETSKARELHGLNRALLQNMILGVTNKFSKTLIAEGVGYKFQLENNILVANVGFTHPVKFIVPSDLEVKVESPVKISIKGIDKEKVGFLAAKIRSIKPPEPYKGKGILYE